MVLKEHLAGTDTDLRSIDEQARYEHKESDEELQAAQAIFEQLVASVREKYKDQALFVQSNGGELRVAHYPPYAPPLRREDASLHLTDLVECYKLPKHFFLDLITKYSILTPERTGEYGRRAVYEFRARDIARIEQVLRLREQGYKMRNIADLIRNQEEFETLAPLLKNALATWYSSSTQDNWSNLLDTFAQVPVLDELERKILVRVHKGAALHECAKELNLASADEAHIILQRAEAKLGRTLFRLLYLGGLSDESQS